MLWLWFVGLSFQEICSLAVQEKQTKQFKSWIFGQNFYVKTAHCTHLQRQLTLVCPAFVYLNILYVQSVFGMVPEVFLSRVLFFLI